MGNDGEYLRSNPPVPAALRTTKPANTAHVDHPTEHVIVTPQPPIPPRANPFPMPPDDLAALREACSKLLADLPAFDRKSILARVSQMRRADDSWRLRDALFDVIARTHGDSVARARLATLDDYFE